MWDFRNKKKVKELESEIFDLKRELFESQQFEEIASNKLKMWVDKYDNLMLAHPELLKNKDNVQK